MFNLLSRSEKVIQDKPDKTKTLKPGRIKKLAYPGAVYGVSFTSQQFGSYDMGKRGTFQKSEYDLGEVAKVMDIEAYVRQAFNKHTELCLKEGYQIKSRNGEATRYIKKRIREIGEASGRNFDSLLRGIIANIVAFSNCFIVKVRSSEYSSGQTRLDYNGKKIDPVAAYFILDPTSMQIMRDPHGKIMRYRQHIPGVGEMPEFKPNDIIHIFYDRKEGFAFGTPYVVPALDDIRSLRRMEENIEMLMLSHLYPLYQYIVGTEDHPAEIYEDGTTEVDIVKEQIENMPTEGSIVTPERHKINVLGAEGKAIAADVYLRHFELRVLAGLGISEIALGRGGTSNRATAATIDKGMQDRCKDFQDVVESFVNEYVMKELLLEGGIQIDDEESNMVVLKFNEIDIDSQIKMENHSVFKYEHDAITESETRELLGKDPITEEQRGDMFFERVTKPKALIMSVDEPYTMEAKGALIQKVSKEEKKKRETLEREQPSNQHGRKLAKTKEKKDQLLSESVDTIIKVSKVNMDVSDSVDKSDLKNDTFTYKTRLTEKLNSDFKYYWDITKDDVFDYIKQVYIEENRNLRDFTPEKLKMILFLTKDSIVRKSEPCVFQAFKDGVDRAIIDSGCTKDRLKIDPASKYQYLKDRIEHYTTGLLSDLGTQLIKEINPEFSGSEKYREKRENIIPTIAGVFDALEYRLRFTAHTEIMKSYNFGYALAMRDFGYKEIYINVNDNHCSKCSDMSNKPLSLEYFSFEDVAPIHPMCNCTYTMRKK